MVEGPNNNELTQAGKKKKKKKATVTRLIHRWNDQPLNNWELTTFSKNIANNFAVFSHLRISWVGWAALGYLSGTYPDWASPRVSRGMPLSYSRNGVPCDGPLLPVPVLSF